MVLGLNVERLFPAPPIVPDVPAGDAISPFWRDLIRLSKRFSASVVFARSRDRLELRTSNITLTAYAVSPLCAELADAALLTDVGEISGCFTTEDAPAADSGLDFLDDAVETASESVVTSISVSSAAAAAAAEAVAPDSCSSPSAACGGLSLAPRRLSFSLSRSTCDWRRAYL